MPYPTQKEWWLSVHLVDIELVNTGRTPAEDVEVNAYVIYGAKSPSRSAKDFGARYTVTPTMARTKYPFFTENIGNIPLGQPTTRTLHTDGSAQFMAMAPQDEPIVYVEGSITYRSPWGSKGETNFCFIQPLNGNSSFDNDPRFYDNCSNPGSNTMR